MENNKKIDVFLSKYLLSLEKDMDKDLELELGMTGDEALDFIKDYSDIFNVKLDEFNFQKYFHDEMMNFQFIIRRIFKIRKKEKLTIRDLLNGIETGYLA